MLLDFQQDLLAWLFEEFNRLDGIAVWGWMLHG